MRPASGIAPAPLLRTRVRLPPADTSLQDAQACCGLITRAIAAAPVIRTLLSV
jgi:hypothetical protein